jgi:hypothetical protein
VARNLEESSLRLLCLLVLLLMMMFFLITASFESCTAARLEESDMTGRSRGLPKDTAGFKRGDRDWRASGSSREMLLICCLSSPVSRSRCAANLGVVDIRRAAFEDEGFASPVASIGPPRDMKPASSASGRGVSGGERR